MEEACRGLDYWGIRQSGATTEIVSASVIVLKIPCEEVVLADLKGEYHNLAQESVLVVDEVN